MHNTQWYIIYIQTFTFIFYFIININSNNKNFSQIESPRKPCKVGSMHILYTGDETEA